MTDNTSAVGSALRISPAAGALVKIGNPENGVAVKLSDINGMFHFVRIAFREAIDRSKTVPISVETQVTVTLVRTLIISEAAASVLGSVAMDVTPDSDQEDIFYCDELISQVVKRHKVDLTLSGKFLSKSASSEKNASVLAARVDRLRRLLEEYMNRSTASDNPFDNDEDDQLDNNPAVVQASSAQQVQTHNHAQTLISNMETGISDAYDWFDTKLLGVDLESEEDGEIEEVRDTVAGLKTFLTASGLSEDDVLEIYETILQDVNTSFDPA